MKDKLIAYLGFAQKSKNLIFGVDNIEAKERKIVMAIIDSSLSDNSLNKLNNIANRNNFHIFMSDSSLDELLGTHNCKAIGLISRDLSLAIKKLNILKEVQN